MWIKYPVIIKFIVRPEGGTSEGLRHPNLIFYLTCIAPSNRAYVQDWGLPQSLLYVLSKRRPWYNYWFHLNPVLGNSQEKTITYLHFMTELWMIDFEWVVVWQAPSIMCAGGVTQCVILSLENLLWLNIESIAYYWFLRGYQILYEGRLFSFEKFC